VAKKGARAKRPVRAATRQIGPFEKRSESEDGNGKGGFGLNSVGVLTCAE
jgi:hypothetical protein